MLRIVFHRWLSTLKTDFICLMICSESFTVIFPLVFILYIYDLILQFGKKCADADVSSKNERKCWGVGDNPCIQ